MRSCIRVSRSAILFHALDSWSLIVLSSSTVVVGLGAACTGTGTAASLLFGGVGSRRFRSGPCMDNRWQYKGIQYCKISTCMCYIVHRPYSLWDQEKAMAFGNGRCYLHAIHIGLMYPSSDWFKPRKQGAMQFDNAGFPSLPSIPLFLLFSSFSPPLPSTLHPPHSHLYLSLLPSLPPSFPSLLPLPPFPLSFPSSPSLSLPPCS